MIRVKFQADFQPACSRTQEEQIELRSFKKEGPRRCEGGLRGDGPLLRNESVLLQHDKTRHALSSRQPHFIALHTKLQYLPASPSCDSRKSQTVERITVASGTNKSSFQTSSTAAGHTSHFDGTAPCASILRVLLCLSTNLGTRCNIMTNRFTRRTNSTTGGIKDLRQHAVPTRALLRRQAPGDSQMNPLIAAEVQSFGLPGVRIVHGQRQSVDGAVHALKHNQTGIPGYRKGIDLKKGNKYLASDLVVRQRGVHQHVRVGHEVLGRNPLIDGVSIGEEVGAHGPQARRSSMSIRAVSVDESHGLEDDVKSVFYRSDTKANHKRTVG
ncbi:hypothetical protein DFH06DRAFT_1149732 [Mycena polygramma]|nr:hypothetical protein DFH06DRAFT_1149732 [Mycena polygramma]